MLATTHYHRCDAATQANLLELANFRDEHSCAISFYFNLSSTPDDSHRQEFTAVKRLIQEAQQSSASYPASASLAQDLDEILNVAEEISLKPARFRAIFACREKQLWREFDLPVSQPIKRLDVGKRFHVFPFVAAMQQCEPYCVVILESGKARGFVVRGTEIEEIEGRLPSQDVSLHAQDSRVGWSRRIDRNLAEHEQAYFKKLSHELRAFMAGQQTSYVVIGCREDLWGEVKEILDFHPDSFMGHFHLPSFAIGSSEVLFMASPVFQEAQRQLTVNLLDDINENPGRAAIGVTDVLRALHEGRAQTLILAKLPNHTVSECSDCGRIWVEAGQNCVFCGSSKVVYLAAEEGLIRHALETDAKLLLVERETIPGFTGAAALLRYRLPGTTA